jgi:hypothetical protein
MPTAIDQTTNANPIADLELVDLIPNGSHTPDDFVSGNKWILGPAPLVARRVDVGVTDTAVKNVDYNIAGAGIATLERERYKLTCCRISCVAMDMHCHISLLFSSWKIVLAPRHLFQLIWVTSTMYRDF